MAGERVQRTLAGDEADPDAVGELPSTFVECPECGEPVLRSRQNEHEHEIRFVESFVRTSDTELDSGEDESGVDPDERVGAWYDIELSYSVEYRFRVPACTQHQAEEIAKEWKFDAVPADSMHVHTTRREGDAIHAGDLPDDFDPYSGERLTEVLLDGD